MSEVRIVTASDAIAQLVPAPRSVPEAEQQVPRDVWLAQDCDLSPLAELRGSTKWSRLTDAIYAANTSQRRPSDQSIGPFSGEAA
jgi:hypothetical protein